MDMPDVVKAYFAADSSSDTDAVATMFATDAVVRDENHQYEGIEAIRVWRATARAKYNHVSEPVAATTTGSRIAVRAKVSGNFPGSPVMLDFDFTVTHDRIVALEIR